MRPLDAPKDEKRTECLLSSAISTSPTRRRRSASTHTGTYLPLIKRAEDGQRLWCAHKTSKVFAWSREEYTSDRIVDGPTLDI